MSDGPLLCGLNEPVLTTVPLAENPCSGLESIAFNIAEIKYNLYLDSIKNAFDNLYYSRCMSSGKLESFTVKATLSEYHYTLYYYDQAGNLVKTVPPAGVNKMTDPAFLNNVKNARLTNGSPVRPAHTLATEYRYNTLNSVVAQKTPDAGKSNFWYDRLGRLVLSMNAKQATENHYSYTLYDALGRMKEVGQLTNTTPLTDAISRNAEDKDIIGSLAWWMNNKPAEQITKTFYDISYAAICPEELCQRNLRNRVSYTAYYESGVPGYAPLHNTATFYSYDIHGNVDVLLQDYGNSEEHPNAMNTTGNRFKRIEYDYDLISGKVNEVSYQPRATDAFYHRYYYDAENRLTDVETSFDKVIWEKDARYSYYKHGPLARAIIGQNQVQGIDYAYTLQGWLKGINSTSIDDGSFDMGADGKAGSFNSNIARDAYGISLNYFNGDYTPVNNYVTPFAAINTGSDLFNGNIKAQVVNIPTLGEALIYSYSYDQLNRLLAMDAYTGLSSTTNVFTPAITTNYKERITYDANGNIQTYLRNGTTQGGTPLAMDNMTYNYIPNTNQLSHVSDNVPASNYSIDIDNQSTFNYTYDQIGNLTKDVSEGINHISWNVYGKITEISKTDGTKIDYSYDPSGNRISKTVNDKVTWYVRDVSGNVMSVYEKNSAVNSGHLTQSEIHLYGSSRLGILTANKDMEDENAGNIFVRGNKIYENTNHLGNVLLTVSDKKTGVDDNSDGIIDYYTADVVSAQDNYCFGMTMPNRSYQSDKYRYGFNGKEKDKDITAGDLDFGARIYDSRLGRWLSTDVLESKYPFASTYCYGLNNPVSFADADGRLIWIPDASYADKITALLEKSFAGKIKVQLVKSDENQRTYLKFELNKDVKLSETETKAFEYLKSLADNQTYTLEVRIYDKDKRIDRYNDYDIDPDNYQSKVLYPNRLADYKPGLGINEAGQYLVHFFAEQYSGVTGQDVYYSAHTFAIGKGGEIFNVKWTSPIGIIKDNKLNVDIDITDKDGNYIQTVRETVDRTTKKSTFTTFIRTDVKPGEKSFGAIMSMDDWAMKTKGRKYDASYSTEYEQYTGNARAAYYKNNPVPDAKKATNNSSTQKTKKNKNG